METIILAGGLGRRLRGIVNNVPKPMADINGKPFLAFLMDSLISRSASRILLSVGYKHEVIESYFGHRYKDIEIDYIFEKEPLGTGGAIKEALKHIKSNDAIVTNGDTFFDLDLTAMFGLHCRGKSLLTIALKKMEDCSRYGTVSVQDNRVVQFEEKAPDRSGFINGGVYIVNKTISNLLGDYNVPFSFEKDFLEEKAWRINILPFVSAGFFIDIGIPEDYEKAKAELPLFAIR